MKMNKIPVPYEVGECSDLCFSCLYDDIPSCDSWSLIEGFGCDDKGNDIVVACSGFKKSTIGSRFVYSKLFWRNKHERVREHKKEVDK